MSSQSLKKHNNKKKIAILKITKVFFREKLLNISNEIEQAKTRKIDGYKKMSKDRLLRIINNNNKENINSIFKSKSLYEPTRDFKEFTRVFLNQKETKFKEFSTHHQKRRSLNQK